MSELHEVYEPGDRVHTVNTAGQLYVWFVGVDGLLTMVQYPLDARMEIPQYPPPDRP